MIYFPNSHNLGSNIKKSGSWGWKSLLYGCLVSSQGCFWVIEDDSKVYVWDDKWIPHLSCGTLQSNLPTHL